MMCLGRVVLRPTVAELLFRQLRSGAATDAVRVLTWHAAKGLEWPVVVLYDLDVSHEGTPLGVQAAGPDSGFSALGTAVKSPWSLER